MSFLYTCPCLFQWRCFALVIAKSYPIQSVIQFSRCCEMIPSLVPTGKGCLGSLNEKVSLICSHRNGENYRVFWENIFHFEKSLSLIPTENRQLHPLNGKNIYRLKNLFTHLDKGCRNAHPFSGFFRKNFLRKFIPSLVSTGNSILGILI